MSRLNIKKDFVDGTVLPAQDLNNNFKQIEESIDDLEGESSYQIAVRNGFIGTEDEWLVALVGPQGQQGVRGPQGDAGSVYGYTKLRAPYQEGVVSFGGRGGFDINDYIIDRTYNIQAMIADKANPSETFLPNKCIHINTKDVSLLKVHVKGDIELYPASSGQANVFAFKVAVVDHQDYTNGIQPSALRDLSQLANEDGVALTTFEATYYFDVASMESVDLFSSLYGHVYDELGSGTGSYVVYPFEIFVEGYV